MQHPLSWWLDSPERYYGAYRLRYLLRCIWESGVLSFFRAPGRLQVLQRCYAHFDEIERRQQRELFFDELGLFVGSIVARRALDEQTSEGIINKYVRGRMQGTRDELDRVLFLAQSGDPERIFEYQVKSEVLFSRKARKEAFLECLIELACTNGGWPDKSETAALDSIRAFLGIHIQDMEAWLQNHSPYTQKTGRQQSGHKKQKRPRIRASADESHYTKLGCKDGDSLSLVKKRYRKLVKQFHPDRVYADSDMTAEERTARFIEIQRAYEAIIKEKG